MTVIDFDTRKKHKENREKHVRQTLEKYIDRLTEDNQYILLSNAYNLYKEQGRDRGRT